MKAHAGQCCIEKVVRNKKRKSSTDLGLDSKYLLKNKDRARVRETARFANNYGERRLCTENPLILRFFSFGFT
jgi:hypothetical protein